MPSPLDYILDPTKPQAIPSPWKDLPPKGFIAGANGQNVVQDYQAGGKYSYYNAPLQETATSAKPLYPFITGSIDQPTSLTTLASGGENHITAWQNGNAKPNNQFAGLPTSLAEIANKNLIRNDKEVNAFNEKAKMFSWGSAHDHLQQPALQSPAIQPIAQQPAWSGSPTSLDRGAYNQTNIFSDYNARIAQKEQQ